ncbi:hypothetical protein J5N97_022679 [Dioscorea zingiberensis]|uniref:Expansin-like A2 n=1 Tax=Dioscorea zingiberensis TaxID=325984 RepID=A0A9D5CAX6_9LILI|nr:hypothetical protein J5N97_022679 [Dioscorea zingiberensis]
MSFSVFFFFYFLISFLALPSTSACDRCVHKSKVSYFSSSSALSAGACGYGSMAIGFNGGGYEAAGNPALYRDGLGCGGCFQIRCTNRKICSSKGVKVVLTDTHQSSRSAFLLSRPAFLALGKQEIMKSGIVDVEYKRISCEYKNNLSVRVEESSQKPNNLVIKFLYQGGQTDIVAVDVAQVGSSDWRYMTRDHGRPVWNSSRVPPGALQMRLVVTGGYDGKWIWADKDVLPADWKLGSVYDSGLQITDIAQEACSPCDTDNWN